MLATRFGMAAVDAVNDGDFGKMVVARGDQVVRESLAVTEGNTRHIDLSLYSEVESTFFG
jgi:6-phosphofructokinase 1